MIRLTTMPNVGAQPLVRPKSYQRALGYNKNMKRKPIAKPIPIIFLIATHPSLHWDILRFMNVLSEIDAYSLSHTRANLLFSRVAHDDTLYFYLFGKSGNRNLSSVLKEFEDDFEGATVTGYVLLVNLVLFRNPEILEGEKVINYISYIRAAIQDLRDKPYIIAVSNPDDFHWEESKMRQQLQIADHIRLVQHNFSRESVGQIYIDVLKLQNRYTGHVTTKIISGIHDLVKK